ncbi:MAG TPA: transcription antitermination factor NusB, partial [Rhizomicrobium sp.]
MSDPEDMGRARRAARLAAVQAVYQMELVGAGAEEVIAEFVEHRFGQHAEMRDLPDEEFFAALVRGVPEHQVAIDKAVAGCLSANWALARV